MSTFWFLVVIELIFGQDILKDDSVSPVLHSAFDQLNKISDVDFSDLSMIEQHASTLSKTIGRQQNNVKLALSQLSNNYFEAKISNKDKDKILRFYAHIQQSMSILSSLSERTYDFYSEQMAKNDEFISNTDEMIMIVNDIRIYHSVEELSDIIDILSNFKKSINDTREGITVLITNYTKLKTQTESYMNEQQLEIPKGFLDKYKENAVVSAVDGFSTTQNVMFWTTYIATIATSTTPLWPIFAATEWGLLLHYKYSEKKSDLEHELRETYDNIDNNVEKSFFALDECIQIMSNAKKQLKDIDNGLGNLLKQIKRIRRTTNELNLTFTDGTARKLLRKLNALKKSFERRQKDVVQRNKVEVEVTIGTRPN